MATFRVYHRTRNRFEEGGREGAVFIEVAEVEAETLDQVYARTNHIDFAWWENEGVTVVGKPEHRSTSVGDEIENVTEGTRFIVAGVGFRGLTPEEMEFAA